MIKEFCFATPPHFGCQISLRGLFLARFLLLLLFAFSAEAIVAQVGDYPGYEDPGDGVPTAEVTIECDRVCVKFTGSISALDNNWDFGDGTTGRGPSVTHCYKDANFYTMKWKYRVSPFDQWTEYEFPLKAIFAGEGCGSVRQISNLVPKVLPAGQLDNSTVYIFGNLEVDVPYQFNGCNVKVLPGEVLRVASGGTLSVTGGLFEPHLLPGCPQLLWNGFEVRENSSLTLNGPTIKAALYGVQPVNLTSSQTLPNLTLTGATFLENFIGFYIKTGKFSLSKFSGNIFTGSTFPYGYRFCGGGSLPTDIPFLYQTYAGVVVEGGMGARFIMPVSAAGNKFSNLPAGVVIQDADALIRGCEFTNILLSYLGNSMPLEKHGSAIIANMSAPARLLTVRSAKVTTADRGIYAKVTGMNSQVNIYNTDMDGLQNGIALESSGANFYGTIQANNINCTRYNAAPNAIRHSITATGISVNYTAMPSGALNIGNNVELKMGIANAFVPDYLPEVEPIAIRITSMAPAAGTSFQASVSGNEIKLPHGLEGIRLTNIPDAVVASNTVIFPNLFPNQCFVANAPCILLVGIHLINSTSNQLQCNTISSVHVSREVGILSESSLSLNVVDNETSNTNGLSLLDNHGTDCVIGGNRFRFPVYFTSFSFGLFYSNAITGPQYLTGNKWYDRFALGAGFGRGSGQNSSYCQSLYTVSPAANIGPGTLNPVSTSYPDGSCGNWFTTIPGATESAPPSSCGGGSGTAAVAESGNDADLSLISSNFSNLAEGQAWSVETALYRKFSEHPEWASVNTTTQSFLDNSRTQASGKTYAVRKGMAAAQEVSSGLAGNLNNRRTQKSDWVEQISNIEALPSGSTSDLQVALDNLEVSGVPFYQQISDEIWGVANTLQAQNSAIICAGQPCLNEQWIHDLYVRSQLLHTHTLTESDYDALQDLAESCPTEGGPAVYVARGWYYVLTGKSVSNACMAPFPNMEEAEGRSRPIDETVTDLRLAPNPAQDETQISWAPMAEESTLTILNGLGVAMQRFVLPAGQQTLQLNTSGYAPGIYWVVLADSKSYQKLLIVP